MLKLIQIPSAFNGVVERIQSELRRRPVAKIDGATFEVKNADANSADVYFYDDIAWYGVNSRDVAAMLHGLDAKTINVHINSGGGDVFEGVAIYNLLENKDAHIVVHIDGVAASIASVIAMAGDERVIAKNASMMVHKAWAVTIGNSDDHDAQSTLLKMVDQQILDLYVERTGKTAADISALVKAQTWMNAEAAKDNGFASEIAGKSSALALIREGMYDNIPEDLLNSSDDSEDVRAAEEKSKNDSSRLAKMRRRLDLMAIEI